MDRAIKCTGWMLVGIGGVAIFVAALLAITVGIIAASVWTVEALDLREAMGPPVAFGYIMLLLGLATGVALCLENR